MKLLSEIIVKSEIEMKKFGSLISNILKPNDLITLDNPNYQYVAARLLLYSLRKQIFQGSSWNW